MKIESTEYRVTLTRIEHTLDVAENHVVEYADVSSLTVPTMPNILALTAVVTGASVPRVRSRRTKADK